MKIENVIEINPKITQYLHNAIPKYQQNPNKKIKNKLLQKFPLNV